MAGHMLYVAFRVLTSSAAFVLVMAGFGLVSGARGVAVLIAATLTGLAFATPAAAWSVGVRGERQIDTVFRMLIMPLYMFSGTFFAVSELPAPIRVLIEALPLAQGVTLCRSLALGTAGAPAIAAHAAYLCALTVIGFALARTAYRRRLHT
jgi:lipooligosaccharide transport system permease protein